MKQLIALDPADLQWEWRTLDNMSAHDFYEIAKLRQQIFIVEQSCIFSDLDELDPITHHLFALYKGNAIAYSRVLPPHKSKDPVYLSRICIDIHYRKHGLGNALVKKALDHIQKNFPEKEVVISAQSYLENFYEQFGFKRIGKPYLEDGIPHIAMHALPKESVVDSISLAVADAL